MYSLKLLDMFKFFDIITRKFTFCFRSIGDNGQTLVRFPGGVISMKMDAVPEDTARAKQDRLEGSFSHILE